MRPRSRAPGTGRRGAAPARPAAAARPRSSSGASAAPARSRSAAGGACRPPRRRSPRRRRAAPGCRGPPGAARAPRRGPAPGRPGRAPKRIGVAVADLSLGHRGDDSRGRGAAPSRRPTGSHEPSQRPPAERAERTGRPSGPGEGAGRPGPGAPSRRRRSLVGDHRRSTSSPAATIPRWWAQRIGDQVDGSMAAGIGSGCSTASSSRSLPLAACCCSRSAAGRTGGLRGLAGGRGDPARAPQPHDARHRRSGNGSAAHAGERILDVEGPSFRAATLAGAPSPAPRRDRRALPDRLAAAGQGAGVGARRRAALRREEDEREARPATRPSAPPGAGRRPELADVRLCFVCLGNICRSPTAEAVMRAAGGGAGLDDAIVIDSAGTGRVARRRPARRPGDRGGRGRGGSRWTGRARQFTPDDFARFDLVLAMDDQNAADLRALAPDAEAPRPGPPAARVRPGRRPGDDLTVPDPYYGGPDGLRGRVRHGRRRLPRAARPPASRGRSRGREPARPGGRRRDRGALGAARPRRVAVGGGSINHAAARHARRRPRGLRQAPPRRAARDVRAPRPHGLAWLAEAGALRTPRGRSPSARTPSARFLALEWIAPRRVGRSARRRRRRPPPSGSAAASPRLHRPGAPAFGLDRDNVIGRLPPAERPGRRPGPAFYAERRLLPMARRAVDGGGLGPATGAGHRAPAPPGCPTSAARPEPPARLHGDLWGGNAILDAERRPGA